MREREEREREERENLEREELERLRRGNSPRWALRNMVVALSLLPWCNTPQEDARLEATKMYFRERGWSVRFRGRNLVAPKGDPA